MSKADLQPRAMQAFEQSGCNANVRVVLVIVGRGEVTAGPHGTAAVGLRLKTLCAFPLGRWRETGRAES